MKKISSAKGKGVSTNDTKHSLIKTVVLEDHGKWLRPSSGASFFISEESIFPDILFEIQTNEAGPYIWSWTINWPAGVSGLKESSARERPLKTFSQKSQVFKRQEKIWLVQLGAVIGGILTVEVKAGQEAFKRSIYIKGKNPDKDKIMEFLKTIDDIKGFDELLEQESKFKHFIVADGMPVVAFDGGYGLTQMTTPEPTYEQVWNWKENIKGGTSLYKQKQQLAKAYLSQKQRKYTDEQLKLETWSRWNGGAYHAWSDKSNSWVRNENILCDSNTGNIGWDMSLPENSGSTEKSLHNRDKQSYTNPKNKADKNKWKYTGICYADHLSR
jgi:hypothetical protein